MNTHYSSEFEYRVRIAQLEETVEVLKKQIAQETKEKYTAYQRIAELQDQITNKNTA